MNQAEKLTDKQKQHPDLGQVLVLGAVKGSRTKVEVQILQRAKGWNEAKQRYERILTKRPNEKMEGVSLRWILKSERNDQYGEIDTVHISDLS